VGTPLLVDDEVPERVLVVTAHPDDVDFGAAGSIARWTAAGAEVVYCIVTDGDAGGFDPAVPREDIPGIRRAEQTAAGAEVGVGDVRFLGYPDGRVEASIELRRDLSKVIREVRPTRVVAQSPERNWSRIYASHPDHLAVGQATACAVYPDARNPWAHPELVRAGFEAWTVPEVWLMAGPKPDRVVDITDTIDRKVAALLRHESQHTEPARMEPLLREWGATMAGLADLPAGRMAEPFQRIVTT
jgi:LmbE family N-acetylglucosaminyl deacetylase